MTHPSCCQSVVKCAEGCLEADPKVEKPSTAYCLKCASCVLSEKVNAFYNGSPSMMLNTCKQCCKSLCVQKANVCEQLEAQGITVKNISWNLSAPVLYEEALKRNKDAKILSTGALAVTSYKKTGRSAKDKRIVKYDGDKVYWGDINTPVTKEVFESHFCHGLSYLNSQEHLFVVDALVNQDPKYKKKVRIITDEPYHAIFMSNMTLQLSEEDKKDFKPEFTVYNAGRCPANKQVCPSGTFVGLDFKQKKAIILGTLYAGEMKKGILTFMMYSLPEEEVLPMHASATVDKNGKNPTVYFGLSGTGKTTLSADPERKLIGDDEHGWHDGGLFNVEGGCYAKAIDLSVEREPDIFNSIKFGAVLENVSFDPMDRVVDYKDVTLTENTRACYPLSNYPGEVIGYVREQPVNIIMLCCDSYGVIPPVARLDTAQSQFYFVSGYTAKVAGTEVGVTEPQATFSPCFGGPFLALNPVAYAVLLGKKDAKAKCKKYLVNTGWVGGSPPAHPRMDLKVTRQIVKAINDGSLEKCEWEKVSGFNFEIPKSIPGVADSSVLNPAKAWKDSSAYEANKKKLIKAFTDNFEKYKQGCPPEIIAGAPTP